MASASSDEGEIIESVTEDLKVASLPRIERNGVDRQDRPFRRRRSQSRSPEHDGRYHSFDSRRSRSPRGYKRPRDDNRDQRDTRDRGGGGGTSRHGQDNRRFRVHYEEPRNDLRRNRISYEDIDRPPSRGSNHGYSGRDRDRNRDRYGDRELDRDRDRDRERDRDRDGFPEKRPRHRSPSPYRARGGDRRRDDRYKKEDRRFDRQGDQARAFKYDNQNRDSWKEPASKRVAQEEDPRSARKEDAKPGQGLAGETQKESTEHAKSVAEPEPEPEVEEPEPFDEDAEIERRRRRREALLAKSSSATPLLIHAVTSTERSNLTSPNPTRPTTPQRQREGSAPVSAPSPASNMNDRSSPEDMDIVNDNDLINTHGTAGGTDEDGPSAADYDPTNDMREDGRRDEMRNGNVGLHGEVVEDADEDKAPIRAEERPAAGDDDDDFNMFAEDFDVDKYAVAKSTEPAAQDTNADVAGGLLDGQDKDGYYKLRPGEVLNGRYQVQTSLGKGMFSGVVRAVDITNKKLVAIKIMRKNDALRKGGFTEIAILQKLNELDPDNRKHIVKFYRHFDHQGHLCMAFENLALNLREVLKRFGNNVGINLPAVRAYAYQAFVALAHMRKCAIIHADLKPDNILVNESRNTLKICDLGTAIDRQDAATAHNELTPYLVSRFYRAPEIILGIPYDYAIDVWSIGCTLYELYTGKILFTGDSNNQMLKAIMEIRGKMTPKMYKRGQLGGVHFDEKGNFISVERDKILNKTTVKTYAVIKPTRDLRTRMMAVSQGMDDAETRDLNLFIDLLEQCLALNPDKRIKPSDALKHPFFTARVAASKVARR